MKATIIAGGPGSGKSTALDLIAGRMQGRIALIDGNNVSWVFPHNLNLEWLNLVQANIASCAANFRDFGIDHLIAAYVLPNRERLDRLAKLLRAEKYEVGAIALRASEETVVRRLIARGNDPERNAELFRVARDCARGVLSSLDGVPCIDTDLLDERQVADQVVEAMTRLERT